MSDQSSSQPPAGARPAASTSANDASAENFVQIVDVVKKFGETVAVKNVPDGRFRLGGRVVCDNDSHAKCECGFTGKVADFF